MKLLKNHKTLDLDWVLSMKADDSSKEGIVLEKEPENPILWREKARDPEKYLKLKSEKNSDAKIFGPALTIFIVLLSIVFTIINKSVWFIIIPFSIINLVNSYYTASLSGTDKINPYQNTWYKISEKGIYFLYATLSKEYFLPWNNIGAIQYQILDFDFGNLVFVTKEDPGFKTRIWASKRKNHKHPTMVNIPDLEENYKIIKKIMEAREKSI